LPEPRCTPPAHLPIRIIGAGLAGPEAAWQCARRGVAVTLYEMRPTRRTPAHESDLFAELVCSNSLKSDSENTAPWLLKQEMRLAGSLLMDAAARAAVPAGHALAVDRAEFSRLVTEAISGEPLIRVVREEVTSLADYDGITIIASGPLTSDALAAEIQRLSGSERLFFYDSISPIVEADSIDESKVYRAARYDKGTADYINCPMTREEYESFLAALTEAQSVDGHDADPGAPEPALSLSKGSRSEAELTWEKANYFEGCLPIEEIARRGPDTLRFGPMKPVGLRNPHTGQMPYAVVQLRQENLRADSYNLVGFQNHLRFGEQARVLRMIPGLENARFLRYGQIHRNTYINAPTLLTATLQMKQQPRILFAGQISGVEGYVESIATGLLAGAAAAALARGAEPTPAPRATAHGSLVHYICNAEAKHFQPANITFDLLEPLDEATRKKVRDKKLRHKMVCDRALAAFGEWWAGIAPTAQ
jgi:methylenetetrahydrofolate--tRNA-(uracil-5-)-methyltransferase